MASLDPRTLSIVLLALLVALAGCGEPATLGTGASADGSGGGDGAAAGSGFDAGGWRLGDAGSDTRAASADASTAAGGDGAAGRDGPIDPGRAACAAIAPSQSASANRKRISDCLAKYKLARLSPGRFPIANGIKIVAGAKLEASTSRKSTLVLGSSSTTNYMIALADNAQLVGLRLDAAGRLKGKANASIVSIGGGKTTVKNNEIYNASTPVNGDRAAAVYIIGAGVSGNQVLDNTLRNAYYGVIFRNGLTKKQINVVKGNKIHDIKCDTVTFAGYGQLIGNTLSRSGWGCENGPIPGGGVYALNHDKGALIERNTISDTCGHGIDLDGVSNFIIRYNKVSKPGYRWGGARSYCDGAAGMFLLDISNSTIEHNDVRNGRASNRVALGRDPNRVFSRRGAALYSDLPSGGRQVVAFVLARRPSTKRMTTGNKIRDNTFIGSCSPSSVCTGLGYFASRGTGYSQSGAWSASTTNYFTGNNPYGSQIGSKRCGGNWYAANSTCGASGGGSCNRDDYQHDPPKGDWARNDKCNRY